MITTEEMAAIRRGIASGRNDYETLYMFYTGQISLEGSMYEAFLNVGTNRTEAHIDGVDVFDNLDQLEGRARKRTLCAEAHRVASAVLS